MARLNQKDLELTLTGKTVDLSDTKNAYLGGEFLTNSRDYIEVLIYDTNNNFLESAIVNEEDYLHDQDTGIKLKTGTILRKLGYDRGRYVVKYNFLRKVAGSYENVLVDSNGAAQYGEYDPETMRIKEYKYFIHEISDSRKEVRLAPQNINEEQYLRDFYYAQKRKKTVQSDGTGDSAIKFEGPPHGQPIQEDSLAMRFPAVNSVFSTKMVGGTLVIPNAFITSYTEIPVPYDGTGVVPEEETEGTIQARFRIDRDASYTEINNANGRKGDPTFAAAFERFANNGIGYGRDDAHNDMPTDRTGIDGAMGSTIIRAWRMSKVVNLADSKFACVYYQHEGNNNASTVVIKSNSTLANIAIPATYLWEVSGYDKAKSGKYTLAAPATFSGDDRAGDYIIESTSDPIVAVPSTVNRKQAQTIDSVDGSTLILKLYSKNLHIGIQLTVSQALGTGESATSMLWLPAIIENQP